MTIGSCKVEFSLVKVNPSKLLLADGMANDSRYAANNVLRDYKLQNESD